MSRLLFNSFKNKVCTYGTNFNNILKETILESRLIETELDNIKNNINILKNRQSKLSQKLKYYQRIEKGLKDF